MSRCDCQNFLKICLKSLFWAFTGKIDRLPGSWTDRDKIKSIGLGRVWSNFVLSGFEVGWQMRLSEFFKNSLKIPFLCFYRKIFTRMGSLISKKVWFDKSDHSIWRLSIFSIFFWLKYRNKWKSIWNSLVSIFRFIFFIFLVLKLNLVHSSYMYDWNIEINENPSETRCFHF
jgi:hypothetical protein